MPVDAAQISPLRILIANERKDRLELLARVVTSLGHEVIAREVDVKEVGAVTAREHPDVAFVGLGLSSEHALELIGEIVHESTCPVIALLSAKDPGYIREAAKRGVFAYIVDADAEELQSLRVTARGGRPVNGALVFMRGTPRVVSGQTQATQADGYVTLTLVPNKFFPQPRNGFNVQFFVKAYRKGDPGLGGIAGYRLVQVRLAG
jgi:DNA-binding NarL/FixJ family response regulator